MPIFFIQERVWAEFFRELGQCLGHITKSILGQTIATLFVRDGETIITLSLAIKGHEVGDNSCICLHYLVEKYGTPD